MAIPENYKNGPLSPMRGAPGNCENAGTPGEASGWLCPAPRGGTSWRGESLNHICIYININKIIHVLLTVPLLNGCGFAFAI